MRTDLNNKTGLEKAIIVLWLILFVSAPFTQKVMRYGFYLPMFLTFYYCRNDLEFGFENNIVGKLLLLFLLFTFFSSLFNSNPSPNISRWFRYFTYVLLYFSIHCLVKKETLSIPFMWSIVLYGVVFAAGNFFFLNKFNSSFKVSGFTDNSVIFGHLASIAFIIVLAFIFDYKPGVIIRVMLVTSLLILLLLIISSQSRGSILGLFFALMLYYYLNSWYKHLYPLVAMLIFFVLIFMLIPDFMAKIEAFSPTDFFSTRNNIWLDSLNFFKANPLWGIGLVSYTDYSKAYGIQPQMNSHNLFLQLLTTAGIFSFFAWVSAIFTTLYLGIRKVLKTGGKRGAPSRVLLIISLLIFAAYIGNGMVEFGIEQGHVGSIFFISMGVVSGLATEPS